MLVRSRTSWPILKPSSNDASCRFGQGDGELYCFFRIVIHVDVHHECRKRHEMFLFARIRALCSNLASVFSIGVSPRMQSRCSMRQHATDWTGCKKLVRDAAEDPFTQSTMSVAAGHDQICALIPNEMKELGGDRTPRLPPHLARHDNSMTAKVIRDIGKPHGSEHNSSSATTRRVLQACRLFVLKRADSYSSGPSRAGRRELCRA
jgi:hypothetical protein